MGTSNSKVNLVDKSGKDNVYITPSRVIDVVRSYFNSQNLSIELDPATEPNNPVGAKKFYTETTNGLLHPWIDGTFVNPPFSQGNMPVWIKKISEEASHGKHIIALLPCGARFGTAYWQDYAFISNLKAICFVRGRVKFLRKDGTVAKSNTYDSQIYGYNIDIAKFKEYFGKLGKVLCIA